MSNIPNMIKKCGTCSFITFYSHIKKLALKVMFMRVSLNNYYYCLNLNKPKSLKKLINCSINLRYNEYPHRGKLNVNI